MMQYCYLLRDFPFISQLFITIFHYINVKMHNVSKVDELNLSWETMFVILFVRSVIIKVTTMA